MPASLKRATLLALASFALPTTSLADLVKFEALGEVSYVDDTLGTAFKMRDKALMIFLYDTDAMDNDPSSEKGVYSGDAIQFFQILDTNYTPYFTYPVKADGTVTVVDGGSKDDSFALRSFSGVRASKDPNDGLIGPDQNGLPLLGAFINFHVSNEDVFQNDKLPIAFGDVSASWASWVKPSFSLQYCSLCATSDGLASGVTFRIIQEQIQILDEDPVTFSNKDNRLIAQGVIDMTTLDGWDKARKSAPQAKALTLSYVPGSDDDDANLHLSQKLHNAGFATTVPSDGLIASGGVDLFLAGTTRILQKGACVGVHSWEGGGKQGADFPKNSLEHDKYLEYYRSIGIDDAFYWFTLTAARADQMHYMTRAEVDDYNVTTVPSPVLGTQAECARRVAPAP